MDGGREGGEAAAPCRGMSSQLRDTTEACH